MHEERNSNGSDRSRGDLADCEKYRADASCSSESVAESQLADQAEQSADEPNSAASDRKATGPRTKAGKGRSSRNSLKKGIFAKAVLLSGESGAEYHALRRGLWDHWEPKGTLETLLVDSLAANLWRKRRLLLAESAEIADALRFRAVDVVQAQLAEVWDRSRAGETAGGMLRPSSNHFLIRECIEILTIFRDSLKKFGFRKDEDPWLLRKVYGLDHDDAAPLGIFRSFQFQSKLATGVPKEPEIGNAPEELKKEMIRVFDQEIKRLEDQAILQEALDKERKSYQTLATLVPLQGAMDRLIRYEAHLGREFDRTANQLERLQRMRRGQPVPPTLKVEVND